MSAGELEGVFLTETNIAAKLVTVVLSSFHSTHNALVALLLLNAATGEITSTVFPEPQRLLFDGDFSPIFGGGGGVSPNLSVWSLVRARSAGDATPLLRGVLTSDDPPFK